MYVDRYECYGMNICKKLWLSKLSFDIIVRHLFRGNLESSEGLLRGYTVAWFLRSAHIYPRVKWRRKLTQFQILCIGFQHLQYKLHFQLQLLSDIMGSSLFFSLFLETTPYLTKRLGSAYYWSSETANWDLFPKEETGNLNIETNAPDLLLMNKFLHQYHDETFWNHISQIHQYFLMKHFTKSIPGFLGTFFTAMSQWTQWLSNFRHRWFASK